MHGLVTSSIRLRNLCAFVLVLGACGSDDEPPLTDATSLECPTPGALPFRLESKGFQKSSNATLAKNDTRYKDEASDVLGNPGGVMANVYLADADAPAASISYAGTRARTMPSQGLFSQPFPGENVSLWYYDTTAMEWTSLDRGVTDDNGHYALAADSFIAPNGAPVYAMLEADGSCAVHRDYLLPPGSKFVVMDIDGTLTDNDNELIMQITDYSYMPKMMKAANTLAQKWAAKGYPIVYLTARPHLFDAETHAWLDQLDFPKGPLITENGGEAADVYKTLWLNRLITTFGWVPFAAYGNAPTDITAYKNAQIPLDRTFIIGPEAGNGGTVAIPNMDYTQHITDFVEAQPNNN
jgi:hypothetical protein